MPSPTLYVFEQAFDTSLHCRVYPCRVRAWGVSPRMAFDWSADPSATGPNDDDNGRGAGGHGDGATGPTAGR